MELFFPVDSSGFFRNSETSIAPYMCDNEAFLRLFLNGNCFLAFICALFVVRIMYRHGAQVISGNCLRDCHSLQTKIFTFRGYASRIGVVIIMGASALICQLLTRRSIFVK